MEQLKSCPFCGLNKVVFINTHPLEQKFVHCINCSIQIPLEVWNTRHSPYELLIKNFIEDVLNHKNNGYDEVSARWVLNQFSTVAKENE